jgi:hypothetical protein
MPYDPDFDVDAIIRILGTINEKYSDGSAEDEALHIAAGALVYLRDGQTLEAYRAYFRKSFAPASSASLISRTFETREEAHRWLASGTAEEGSLVSIAGEGFTVVKLPNRWELLRTPLPEELSRT